MNDSSTEKSVVDILFELQLIEEGEDPIQNLRDTIKEIRIVAHDLINKNYFRNLTKNGTLEKKLNRNYPDDLQ